MKQLYLFILLFLGLTSNMLAQTSYTVSSTTCDTTLSSAGVPVQLSDDTHSQRIAIGFPFCFYGQTHDSLLIGSNSCLSFNLSLAGMNKPFSVPALGTTTFSSALYNTIQGPLQDLNPGVGGDVSYYTVGSPPNRVFVVQYDNVPYFGQQTAPPFSGKIMLYETSNAIEVHLIDRQSTSTTNSGRGMMALISPDTAAGQSVFPANYWGAWSAYHEAIRYTPFGPCSGPGEYNLVRGNIYFDMNANCVSDGTDFPLGNQLVTSNGLGSYTFTDQYGNYALVVDTGTFVIQHTPMTLHNVLCPAAGYTTSFSNYGNTVSGFDFADTARQCVDLVVDVSASWQRLCRTNNVYVTYGNHGTIAATAATVTVTLPDSTLFVSSTPAPSSVSGNVITYNISSLLPNQTGTIVIRDSVLCDTSLMGDPLEFAADIQINSGIVECDNESNAVVEISPVVASWDPNDMRVHSPQPGRGYVAVETIEANDELTFMIRFQNEGTFYAEDVRIVTILPAELNEATIIPGASSHQYQMVRYGNEVRFIFNAINLPWSSFDEPGSHGFVKFRINQASGNGPGDVFDTQADIFFDNNPAVRTNDAILSIASPTGVTTPLANNTGVVMAPNPVSNILTVSWEGHNLRSLSVMDATGRQVTQGFNGIIDMSNLPAGLYIVRAEDTEGQVASSKIIKQ